ncbi:hypothetical protein [Agromyces humi]|uniref:hypothetical protein n=1 Tax=Agromyces humi TaxID=1766800 RepID=UPI00135AFC2F|nr:hypothetical protein [Agromyces humi]
MPNRRKEKGDKGERDAVEYLVALCPDLCRPGSMRMLGAGRAQDVGDLWVFTDAAVQVKAYGKESLSSAMYTSATSSVVQAANGRVPYGVGMVKMHNARPGTNRWVAAAVNWPAPLDHQPVEFKAATVAAEWAKRLPADDRSVGIITRAGAQTIYVAPFHTWVDALRVALSSP